MQAGIGKVRCYVGDVVLGAYEVGKSLPTRRLQPLFQEETKKVVAVCFSTSELSD